MKPGDTLGFRLGDLFPADDPLSEWLLLLSMALNDVALVNDRLEREHEILHAYLYWLRLGVAHFFEAAKLLKRGKDIPQVSSYVATLPADVRANYDRAISIYDEHHEQLKMMRDVLFHYVRRWTRSGADPEPVIHLALERMADDHATLGTGTLETARSLYADDVVAAIFTRATGVAWEDVTKDESQQHVGEVQLQIGEAVSAFVGFANPALMHHFGRAMSSGTPERRVEPIDPEDLRRGWKYVDE